jgi:hypothetical protein
MNDERGMKDICFSVQRSAFLLHRFFLPHLFYVYLTDKL